ncbi:MAG TPA: anhydro-N-acetylmuramic acid kinase, partial [Mariprofundaceae bacterium]|nr:anhydro-N-acetylmuramic acid kinase [Mariprofundaceae bacterium]
MSGNPSASPLIIGLMSGTSCDGIDAAIVRFDDKPALLHFSETPMPEELREPVLRLAEPGMDEIDPMGELDRLLGRAFGRAALTAIDAAGLKPSDIAAIGSHGQTIRHRPRARNPFTLQIGCPATIAELTGITTIADFRRRDVAAGGEGAPLVPFAHRELFAVHGEATAIVNIGGIANITFIGTSIGSHGEVLGFDTGPGNMVMDGLMLVLSDGRSGFDAGGELAASGEICRPLLEKLLAHPFLARRPPKSTGREEFGQRVVDEILGWPDLTDADRLATACEWTAQSIADAARFLPEPPARWHICGGGAANGHLMQRLTELLDPAPV